MLKMKGIFNAGLLIALALFVHSDTYALQLIYPLDGTHVTKSNYLIIKGGTDPVLSGFSIEINGVKSDVIDVSSELYHSAFGDMLVVEPLFDPGENRIVVEGYLGGEKMATSVATIYYRNRMDVAAPEAFPKEVFHAPEREKPCEGCHNMTPSPTDLSKSEPSQHPCASCHVRMLSKDHVHGPAGVYECTYCHDIESKPTKYRARPGDASLCVECHEDKLEEFRKAKFVHGPIDAGLCMVCHDPHASNQRGQLVMPAYDLCVECHEQVIKQPHVTRGSVGKVHPLKGVTNPAGLGEDLSCASCHDPHSGASSAMFRWGLDSRFALCAKCHNK